ncbi:MAG: MBL fold metallo-hydrolase [Cellulosilyticaceae bacterium]
MKITFLGTGAATAAPLPFCNCKICKCARLLKGKDVRKRASILINDDLLIDLGPDAVSACMQYDKDLTQVKYILQTHAHSDHFDAGHLITRHRDYAVKNINALKIVASYGTLVAMNKALQDEEGTIDLFNEVSQSALSLTVDTMSHQEEKWIGEYKVTGLESLHDTNQESLIYLIEHKGKSVLYGTDLLEVSEKVYEVLEGKKIDIIILDQTYGEGYNAGGHLDAGQIKKIIMKMNELEIIGEHSCIYATHISHEGNGAHSEMARLAHQSGYDIAYDGYILEI